jgi:glycosyltransferase involved in cell wall biosynthesis
MNNQYLGINFFGPIYTEDGIGEAARLTLKAFQNAGINVAINPLPRPVAREKDIKINNKFKIPYKINYFHFSARWVEYYLELIGKEKLNNKYNICYWVTEIKDYPDEWAKFSYNFDEIWTASSFCLDSISMKVFCPIILIPHPIIKQEANKIDIQFKSCIDNSKFNFLVMANMYSDIERKNILQTLDVFQKSFPSKENVLLVIKISNGHIDPEYMKKIKNYTVNDKRMILIDDFLTREEIVNLFQSVNSYVSLHRAEGFGLTLGEAMCCDIPVIATAYSGNMDFCNCFNSYLVDYDLVKVGEDRLRYKKNDIWAQPKYESAIAMFKKVYNEPQDVLKKTKSAKEFIETNFSINTISAKILKRIKIINLKILSNKNIKENS